jgi:hypothetical protein
MPSVHRCVFGLRVAGTVLCTWLVFAASAAADPGWRSYVQAPDSGFIRPERIESTEGTVTTPEALVTGRGSATMTYTDGGAPPVIILDYGKEVGGFPTFAVSAFTGTPTLRTSYSETEIGLEPDGDYAGKQRLTRVQEFPITAGGRLRSRMLEGGQRYERLTLSAPGTLTLSSAGIAFTPVRGTADALRGDFVTSDPLLNRIWYAGVYTVNLDQVTPGLRAQPGQIAAKPVLVDGAKRDRKIWSGDLLTTDPTVFYALDPTYVRESLRIIGDHPAAGYEDPDEPAPRTGVCSPNTTGGTGCLFYSATYSMMFVLALTDYYTYTGDRAFVRRQWHAVERQMAWDAQQVDARGLFAVDDLTGFNWNLEVFGGELTYVNAVYYQALGDAAVLADAVGEPRSAKLYRKRAKRIKRIVNRRLWNPARGIYELSTTQRDAVVQDANVHAVLSGIASPEQADSALAVVDRTLRSPYGILNVSRPSPANFRPVISPYMGGLQLQAEFEAGRSTAALGLMRTEWGWMLDHDPESTVWEKIQTDGRLTPRASAAHAWSSGATSALSHYVLGAAPVTAGWKTWSVKPFPGDLTYAHGNVPTPFGTLTVRWDHAKADAFRLVVQAPKKTAGTVSLPLLGGRRTVTRDGDVILRKGKPQVPGVEHVGDYVVIDDQTGGHRYAWAPPEKKKKKKQVSPKSGHRAAARSQPR